MEALVHIPVPIREIPIGRLMELVSIFVTISFGKTKCKLFLFPFEKKSFISTIQF